jgi:hypothetical protein
VLPGHRLSDQKEDPSETREIETIKTMSTQPKIYFDKDDGGGVLSIYYYDGPYGLAQDAKKGDGVLFLAPNGEILGGIFDFVRASDDKQVLTAPNGDSIEISTAKGKVSSKLVKRRKKAS